MMELVLSEIINISESMRLIKFKKQWFV